jgi:hypothetical protein
MPDMNNNFEEYNIEQEELTDSKDTIPTSYAISQALNNLKSLINQLKTNIDELSQVEPNDETPAHTPIPGATLTHSTVTANKSIVNIADITEKLILNKQPINGLDIDALSASAFRLPSSYLLHQLLSDIEFQLTSLKIPKTTFVVQEFPINLLNENFFNKVHLSEHVSYTEGRIEFLLKSHILDDIQGIIEILPNIINVTGVYFLILSFVDFTAGEVVICDYQDNPITILTPNNIDSKNNIFVYFTSQTFNNRIRIYIKNVPVQTSLKFNISLVRFNEHLYQCLMKLFEIESENITQYIINTLDLDSFHDQVDTIEQQLTNIIEKFILADINFIDDPDYVNSLVTITFLKNYLNSLKSRENVKGLIEIANQDEVDQGTNKEKAVVPFTLHNKRASETDYGILKFATETEARIGTSKLIAISPYVLQKLFIDLVENITVNASSAIETSLEDITSHIHNTSNPHTVTKAQVGLSNIPNNISSDVTNNEVNVLATTKMVTDSVALKQDIITGAATTVTNSNLTFNKVLISNSTGKIDVGTISDTELGYLSGLTSNIQTQLTTINTTVTNVTTNIETILSGAVSSIIENDLDINKVVVSDNEGKLTNSEITTTELEYLNDVTSNIQTQLNSKQDTIIGAGSTIVSTNFTIDRALISNSTGKIDISTVTSDELNYLSGVTSDIQTQINNKQDSITGAATTVISSDLIASKILVSNTEGKIAASNISETELSYISGASSNIQIQLNNKQDTITGAITTVIDTNLTTNKILMSNDSGKIDVSTITDTELGYLSGLTSNIQDQINNNTSGYQGYHWKFHTIADSTYPSSAFFHLFSLDAPTSETHALVYVNINIGYWIGGTTKCNLQYILNNQPNFEILHSEKRGTHPTTMSIKFYNNDNDQIDVYAYVASYDTNYADYSGYVIGSNVTIIPQTNEGTIMTTNPTGSLIHDSVGYTKFLQLIDGEINNVSLIGVPVAPTAAVTVNSTQIATTAFVHTAVANAIANIPHASTTEYGLVRLASSADIANALK